MTHCKLGKLNSVLKLTYLISGVIVIYVLSVIFNDEIHMKLFIFAQIPIRYYSNYSKHNAVLNLKLKQFRSSDAHKTYLKCKDYAASIIVICMKNTSKVNNVMHFLKVKFRGSRP